MAGSGCHASVCRRRCADTFHDKGIATGVVQHPELGAVIAQVLPDRVLPRADPWRAACHTGSMHTSKASTAYQCRACACVGEQLGQVYYADGGYLPRSSLGNVGGIALSEQISPGVLQTLHAVLHTLRGRPTPRRG